MPGPGIPGLAVHGRIPILRRMTGSKATLGGRRAAVAAAGFWIGLLGIAALSCWLRIRLLDASPLTMDAYHPWQRALAILEGQSLPWRGEGSGFHYGALQAWLVVPMLAAAGGLQGALTLNAALHGLGAVPIGLAGRRLGGVGVGWVAAVLYASWPILVLHPQAGFYTYQVPVFIALACWAASRALRVPGWGAVVGLAAALACAVSLHPFALAAVAGAVVLLPGLIRVQGLRRLVPALLVGLAILAPVIVDNAILRFAEPVAAAEYDLIQETEADLRTLLQFGLLEIAQGWPPWMVSLCRLSPLLALLAIPALPATTRWTHPGPTLVLWTLASYAAYVALCDLLNYTQPYHAAAVIPIHALAIPWAAATILRAAWRWLAQLAWTVERVAASGRIAAGVCWAGAAVLLALALRAELTVTRVPAGLGQIHLGTIVELTRAIREDAGGVRPALALVVDTDRCQPGQILAYHAEQTLRGDAPVDSPASLAPYERARAYVIAELDPSLFEAWGTEQVGPPMVERTTDDGMLLRLLRFSSIEGATRWLARGCPLRETTPGLEVSELRRSLGGLPGWTAEASDPGFTGQYTLFCAHVEDG